MKRKHRIRVIYKSGAIMDFDCNEFTVERNSTTGWLECGWTDAWPNPLLLGIDDIAAVFEIDKETEGDSENE